MKKHLFYSILFIIIGCGQEKPSILDVTEIQDNPEKYTNQTIVIHPVDFDDIGSLVVLLGIKDRNDISARLSIDCNNYMYNRIRDCVGAGELLELDYRLSVGSGENNTRSEVTFLLDAKGVSGIPNLHTVDNNFEVSFVFNGNLKTPQKLISIKRPNDYGSFED